MARLHRVLLAKHGFGKKNCGSSFGDGPPLGVDPTRIALEAIGQVVPHAVLQADGQISRLHTTALSNEIVERLRFGMDWGRSVAPLHLLKLMTQFQRAERPGD